MSFVSRIKTVVCTLLIGLIVATLAPQSAQAQSDERCFQETGYCIAGRIRTYWEQNGGLEVFGLPIAPQQQETIEGQMLQVQWFERNRLELHPENAPPYDVLLGRLGVDVLEQQSRDWQTFPTSSPQNGCLYFAEMSHNVCGDILSMWQANGLEQDGVLGFSQAESTALFGFPISDVMNETLSDGNTYQVQYFERARFELHPENQPPYNVLLGLLGTEIGATPAVAPPAQGEDYDSIIAQQTQILAQDPNNVDAYTQRGMAYYYTGNYDRAIADFTQAIALDPNNPSFYNNRGLAYKHIGDYTNAVHDYTKAIEMNPNEADFYANRGNVHILRDDYENAVTDFTQALAFNSSNADFYNLRGLAFYRLQNYDDALNDYNQAIQLDPANPILYYNRGLAYEKKADFDSALNDYNKAIEMNPNDADFFANRGSIYLEKQDYTNAISDFTRAIEINPNDAQLYSFRGVVYLVQGDYTNALENFNQAIERDPNLALLYYERGVTYYQMGNYELAATDFRKYVPIGEDPELLQDAHNKLAELGG